MTTDTVPSPDREPKIACNPDGKVIGVESAESISHGMSFFTSAETIRSLWSDLVAGKNTDQERLASPGSTSPPRATITDPAKTIAPEIERAAVLATVRIRLKDSTFSGTIITAEGLIATCAHHYLPAGTTVMVALPDGRDVAGEGLGSAVPCDAGFVRITEPGIYPHVKMGDSTSLAEGEACLAIGYGPVDGKTRQPRVRQAQVVEPPDGRWAPAVRTAAALVGGDSGGGLFDSSGRLVGFHSRIAPYSTHGRVELFRVHRAEVEARAVGTDSAALAVTGEGMESAVRKLQNSVAEVQDGEKTVALATVLGADGRLVTKASTLPDAPRCRLPDGRILPAVVMKIERENDLALLKIAASDLPAVTWSAPRERPVGAVVSVMSEEGRMVWGCVGHPAPSFPGEEGWLRARLEEGAQGLKVAELYELPNQRIFTFFGLQPLRPGDIVLGVEGHSTPTLAALGALLDPARGPVVGLAGNPVRVRVRRAEKEMDLRVMLGPPSSPRLAGQSARSSGFSHICHVTANQPTNLCGGPVLDAQGEAWGLAIAWRAPGWLLVLPGEIAAALAAEN